VLFSTTSSTVWFLSALTTSWQTKSQVFLLQKQREQSARVSATVFFDARLPILYGRCCTSAINCCSAMRLFQCTDFQIIYRHLIANVWL
jgi:hypothetical protein